MKNTKFGAYTDKNRAYTDFIVLYVDCSLALSSNQSNFTI